MSGTTPTPPADGTLRLTPITPATDATAGDPAPAAVTQPRIMGAATAMPAGAEVKKAEFIDRVVARGQLRKREARAAIEAALAELADILTAGGELALPPMGKIKAVKVKDLGDGAQLLTIKLRTMKDGAGGSAPVAAPDRATGDTPSGRQDGKGHGNKGQGGKGQGAKGQGAKARRTVDGSVKNPKSGVADGDDEG